MTQKMNPASGVRLGAYGRKVRPAPAAPFQIQLPPLHSRHLQKANPPRTVKGPRVRAVAFADQAITRGGGPLEPQSAPC